MRRLRGIVVTGTGDLAGRMRTVPGLLDAYERRTGLRLHPGSLNVQLEEEFRVPPGAARLEREDYGGAVAAWLVPCTIARVAGASDGVGAFIVRTERNEAGDGVHPRTLIEVVSDQRLRDALGVADGDEVVVDLSDGHVAAGDT